MEQKLLLLFTLTFLRQSQALIGFNCGSNNPTITTYSLLDTGDCDFDQVQVNSSQSTIELLQRAEFRSINVIQCKIEIRRTVLNCGLFSHLSPTPNAIQEYIYELSHEECKIIHETGIFKYDNTHTIADLKVNSTKSIGIDLAGNVEGKSCSGAAYSDRFGTWSNVLVQGLIKITLLESSAAVSLNNNKIRLNTGTVCKFSDQHCIDMEGGYTFWPVIPREDCFQNEYDVLYRGPVTKIMSPNQETLFSISTDEVSFALSAKGNMNYCNRMLTKTEHPKLLVYERNNNNIFFDNDVQNKQGILNYDLFTYFNSKFVYVEKHFRADMQSLYLNVLKGKCELEKKVLYNSLSFASISPDEFAYNLMERPGYIARLAGEAVHIIQCTPIEVQIKHMRKCFAQLPVAAGNKTFFLTPKTHILLETGTEINCNTIIPQYYRVGNQWISLMPEPRTTNNKILNLKPATKITWEPTKLDALATSGIYSQDDLQEIRQQALFPMEKASILNGIARGILGEENIQGGLISNLFTENTLTKIAENTWKKFIEKLTEFGSISSAVIMIIIIFQLCKTILDMIIRGYTLHTIYGFSAYLLGAMFASITSLLIALSKRKNKKPAQNNEYELQEIIVEKPGTAPVIVSEPLQEPRIGISKPTPPTIRRHLQCQENSKLVQPTPLLKPPQPNLQPKTHSPSEAKSITEKTHIPLFTLELP